MSETTNLKLFKHDNPSTNTDQFDVEKALNENWDKIEEFAEKVNDKVIEIEESQDDHDTLIQSLQAENALLKSQIPIGTVEGEYISIKDSASMPFKSFKIGGNDYQKTSEASSNILDPNKLTSGFINMDTGALEGVNSTYPNSTYTPPIKLNTNDVLRIFNSPSAGQRLRIYNLDGTYNSYVNESYYTAETDCLVRVLFLDTINNNTSIKINNANSTYEEFTPDMPSTKYESPVRACGDNVNILITENSSNYTINSTDGVIENNDRLCSDFIKVNSNKQDYILSANQSLGFVGIAFYDKDKNYVGRGVENGVKTLAITKPQGIFYLRVFFQGNLLSSQSWFDYGIKLEKGSTATTYSKPNQGNIRIKKNNKNLLNLLNQSLGSNTTASQNKTSNSIELIAIGTWSNCSYTFQNFEKNTHYTISANFMETIMDKNIIGISVYGDKNGSWTILKGDNRETTKNKVEGRVITFNTGDYDKIHIRFWNNYSATAITRGNSLVKITNIQLEEGTLATGYVEHQSEEYIVPTQQPFYEGDTFVKVDGVRYEKHNKYRKIFDGTENIILSGSVNGIYQFNITVDDLKIASEINYKNDVLSNGFGSINYWTNSWLVDNVVLPIVKEKKIRFQTSKYIATEEFKTELAEQHSNGTPIYIVYPLAEPTLTPCTEEQNAILDEIEKDDNYKNVTIITSEDEIKPNVSGVYYKDLETILNNISSAVIS